MALRRFHGNHVGAITQAVHVCDKCGAWQTDYRGRPLVRPDFFCMDRNCNGTQFTRFDSMTEAKAWAQLLLREAAGEIDEIERQVNYPLHAPTPDGGKALVWSYRADFRYRDRATGLRIVIDVKGSADTHISAAKRKHCEFEYGITIRIMQPPA